MGSVSRLSSATSISTLLALMVSCGGGSGPTAIAPPAVTTNATSDPSQDLIDPILDPFLPQGFALSGGSDLTQLLMSQTLLDGLKRPYGIAFDGSHLVVAEFGFSLGSSGLRVASPAGDPISFLAAGQVGRLRGVAIDGSDYLALDGGSGAPGRLFRVSSTGASPQLVAGDLGVAMSVETIGADDYLVTNQEGQLLRIQQGQVSPIAEGLGFIYGVAVEDAQTYLVTDLVEGRLLQVDAGGGVSPLVTEGMGQPRGVTVESPGVYLVSDFGWETGQGRLLRVRPSEMEAVEVIASGIGNPVDAAILDEGVYGVTDFQSNRVLLIDEEIVAQQPSPSPEPSSAPGSPPPLLPTRPGPYPSPEVEGAITVVSSDLGSCLEGSYPIQAQFNDDFTSLTINSLGAAAGCFTAEPLIIEAPELVDGGSSPITMNSLIPEGYDLGASLRQTYGGFDVGILYKRPGKSNAVDIEINLHSMNIKIGSDSKGITQLEGPPQGLASDVLPSFSVGSPRVFDPERQVSRTTLHAILHKDATIAEVNGMLASLGAAIVSSTTGGAAVTLALPDTGQYDGLKRVRQVLFTHPAVFLTSFDYQMEPLGPRSQVLLAQAAPPLDSTPLPIQFIAQAAFDLNSAEPVALGTSSGIDLWVADSWGCSGHTDLNLISFVNDCGEYPPDPFHGIEVSGMAAAKLGPSGLYMGMFPGNAAIKGYDFLTIGETDLVSLARIDVLIDQAVNSPGKKIVNFSVRELFDTVDLGTLNEAARAGYFLAEKLIDVGAESNVVFVAAAGNSEGSTAIGGSAFTAAAELDRASKLNALEVGVAEDCKERVRLARIDGEISEAEEIERQGSCETEAAEGINERFSDPEVALSLEPPQNILVVANASLTDPGGVAPSSSTGNNTVFAISYVENVDRQYFIDSYDIDPGCDVGFAHLTGTESTGCLQYGGSSLAAGQASGLALTLWNRESALSPAEVVQQIKDTVSPYPVLNSSGRFSCAPDTGKLDLSEVNAINFAKALDLEEPPIQICDLEFAEFTLPEQTSTDSGQLRLQTRLLWDNGDQAYDNQTQPPILLTLEVENGTLDATDLDPS